MKIIKASKSNIIAQFTFSDWLRIGQQGGYFKHNNETSLADEGRVFADWLKQLNDLLKARTGKIAYDIKFDFAKLFRQGLDPQSAFKAYMQQMAGAQPKPQVPMNQYVFQKKPREVAASVEPTSDARSFKGQIQEIYQGGHQLFGYSENAFKMLTGSALNPQQWQFMLNMVIHAHEEANRVVHLANRLKATAEAVPEYNFIAKSLAKVVALGDRIPKMINNDPESMNKFWQFIKALGAVCNEIKAIQGHIDQPQSDRIAYRNGKVILTESNWRYIGAQNDWFAKAAAWMDNHSRERVDTRTQIDPSIKNLAQQRIKTISPWINPNKDYAFEIYKAPAAVAVQDQIGKISNGDMLVAIVRKGVVKTIMWRRSPEHQKGPQPFTPQALGTDYVFRWSDLERMIQQRQQKQQKPKVPFWDTSKSPAPGGNPESSSPE